MLNKIKFHRTANGLASVKKAGKVKIAASGWRDIVTTAKTTIKVRYFYITSTRGAFF
jgi:hypothetical protein